MDSKEALVDGYLDSLISQRKLSAHTVDSYRRDLVQLMQLADAVSATLESVTHFHVRKFAAQLHSQGLNPRSIARKLSAWRGFFNWLSEQMPLAANPVDGVKAPKRAKPLPKALSADDAVRLVSEKTGLEKSVAQLCNHAMFELLYSSGLRVSELAGLDLRYVREDSHESQGWIDLEECSVTVTGKGSRMRSVPVGRPAMEAIA
ncbi:MAG: recombinase XerC, partial [Paucimonas sp.]|nr:recombinase XerC [Paucimonas sp.]